MFNAKERKECFTFLLFYGLIYLWQWQRLLGMYKYTSYALILRVILTYVCCTEDSGCQEVYRWPCT